MATFEVYGKIIFNVIQEIEAATEEEAVTKVKDKLRSYHHLFFDDDEINYDLDAVEYEE